MSTNRRRPSSHTHPTFRRRCCYDDDNRNVVVVDRHRQPSVNCHPMPTGRRRRGAGGEERNGADQDDQQCPCRSVQHLILQSSTQVQHRLPSSSLSGGGGDHNVDCRGRNNVPNRNNFLSLKTTVILCSIVSCWWSLCGTVEGYSSSTAAAAATTGSWWITSAQCQVKCLDTYYDALLWQRTVIEKVRHHLN